MKRIITLLSITILSIMLLVGCGSNKTKNPPEKTTNNTVQSNSQTQVKDNAGTSSTDSNKVEFKKTEKDIQDDLVKNETGFMEPLHLSVHTFSFTESDTYKVKKINEFKIVSVEAEQNPVLTDVIIETNVDFEIKNANDVTNENGSYNIAGKFKVTYKLDKDGNGNSVWSFFTPKLTSFTESNVTKK